MTTNDDRADRAYRTLQRHIEHELGEVFDSQSVEDLECELATLLADLRHLAAEEKADFHRAIALSQAHYNAETAEEIDRNA